MKLLIASDLHGSALFTRRLLEHVRAESPDRIVLLGDVLYHGPRNDLPQGYAPKEVISLLNAEAQRITAVRGNCDAEVDQMVLDFPCTADYALIADGPYTLFCTHGHVYTPDNLPSLPTCGAAFLSGHTHVKALEERNGLLFANPGSVSIPKDGTRSFAVYENGTFTLKRLDDGVTLKTLSITLS